MSNFKNAYYAAGGIPASQLIGKTAGGLLARALSAAVYVTAGVLTARALGVSI